MGRPDIVFPSELLPLTRTRFDRADRVDADQVSPCSLCYKGDTMARDSKHIHG